ncbi:MAG: transposase [Betaproteobacteria bacterium]
MPRPCRQTPGGLVYHVLNRANARRPIFETHGDYLAFEQILADTQRRTGMRILAWCLMPNHWHLLLWPLDDGEISHFTGLATLTHVQRWHAYHGTAGNGHLYQGRFKSFLVQDDAHLLTVCRYVEANALRAQLVARAEEWRWGSLWQLRQRGRNAPIAEPWPLPRPSDWMDIVNEPIPPTTLNAIRRCATRGSPYGGETWVEGLVNKLGLQSTLRSRGRPRRKKGS